MKKDFNYPTEDVIPHFTGMPCDCVDCVKNAAYTKQLNDRNAIYVNSFDFPDWNDLKIGATELLGYATGNPAVVVGAQNAAQLKDDVKTAVAQANATGATTWTNLPKDANGNYIVPAIDPIKLAPTAAVDISNGILSFIPEIKYIIYAVIAVVLIGIFLRIRG